MIKKYRKNVVSIVVTCYNSEKYIGRCLKSLINQTYPNLEIIVVNDGSKDNSKYIIDECKSLLENENKIMQVIDDEVNRGVAEATKKGLQEISGEYFMWCDSDDYYYPDAVYEMKKILDKSNKRIVRCAVDLVDENNQFIKKIGSKNKGNEFIFESYVTGNDAYAYPGIFLVKTELLDERIPNRDIFSNTREGQNWQILLPMLYNEQCKYIDHSYYCMEVRQDSHSRMSRGIFGSTKRLIKLHFLLRRVVKNIAYSSRNERRKYVNMVDKLFLNKIKNEYLINPIKRRIGGKCENN